MPAPTTPPPTVDAAIDFRAYHRAPQLPAAQCMPFALALLDARPRGMSQQEKTAFDRAFDAGKKVEDILGQRDLLGTGKVRPRLDAFVNAWKCCSEVLDAYARLASPLGDRARAIRAITFQQRYALLSSPTPALWGEAMRRYRRLMTESSRHELVAVVGEELVLLLETTMKELADVIGCGDLPPVRIDPGVVARSIREFQLALVAYVRVLSGSVLDDDPASLERFRRAVAPIDELRQSRARRSARNAGRRVAPEATPETTAR